MENYTTKPVLRLEILEFAQAMEGELQSNENVKGNIMTFARDNINGVLLDLEYHKAKLIMALRAGDLQRVKEFSADTANYLMTLFHTTNEYIATHREENHNSDNIDDFTEADNHCRCLFDPNKLKP